MTAPAALFSRDYFEARQRFREAAVHAGCALQAHTIGARGPDGESLTIDVAIRRTHGARRALVVSSGTHGVEGFFGSAVQLAFLQGLQALPACDTSRADIVLIHAVNPYGFAHVRRVNEDNVDLNRNFVLPGGVYAGAPPVYAELSPLLNPESAPGGFDPFLLNAGLSTLRHGFKSVKNAVAQGQYDFPRGLFFGGTKRSESAELLAAELPTWLGPKERTLHVDLHTGMGRYGSYALCVDLPVQGPRVAQLRREFGREHVQGFDPNGVLYEMRGSLSRFLDQHIAEGTYDCMLAEFGTYASLRVLSAMRFDNRVAHFASGNRALVAKARAQMLEAFCPADPRWRAQALFKASDVLTHALAALAA